jgi:hypothetical protein
VPGDFGRRISGFVKGLRHRPADVCVDARLVNLAAAWAGCAADDSEALHLVHAWRKLLGWFAYRDHSGKIPFKEHMSLDRSEQIAELKTVASVLVPESTSAVEEERKKLLHQILDTYTARGWLKQSSGGGLLAKFSRPAPHPLARLIDDLFKQSRR